jgi:S1-C subfamily serine protease
MVNAGLNAGRNPAGILTVEFFVMLLARSFALLVGFLLVSTTMSLGDNAMPVSAPITEALAGKAALSAVGSVFRIIDVQREIGGTGFLHRSGRLITAAHVVSNPNTNQLRIILQDGTLIAVQGVVLDADIDVAIVTPVVAVKGDALPISQTNEIPVGTEVSTWGFPEGYGGLVPLLTVGYVSGTENFRSVRGKIVPRFVVNAAFNSGNSGGPVIRMDDGVVVGVVSSKLAPVPPYILAALQALQNQQSGLMYQETTADGKQISLSEGKIIGDVLVYLRSQTQLVVGYSVPAPQLADFLKSAKIDP